MFSVRQKREISDAVHRILRDTEHQELPKRGQPIRFQLHVEGAEAWSWADIENNAAVKNPGVNPWNELQDTAKQGPSSSPSALQAPPPQERLRAFYTHVEAKCQGMFEDPHSLKPGLRWVLNDLNQRIVRLESVSSVPAPPEGDRT